VFVESYAPPPRMIVFGAIDFAVAVVRMGKFLGYHALCPLSGGPRSRSHSLVAGNTHACRSKPPGNRQRPGRPSTRRDQPVPCREVPPCRRILFVALTAV